ncbi:lantibiotic dehydratase [Chitinophaga vietnamensis]|uniref:lantibiotic dehydratase n=1 Tax=Chitinophaga vietnamensis TaxID=2593957 RepID=UPI001177B3EA|nr:lantibiotic dehydratase [Chitinophaga vietnamensis]
MDHQSDFFTYDHYLLRTPAIPVDAAFELNKALAAIDLDNAVAIMAAVDKLLADPLFYEALYIGARNVFNTWHEIRDKFPEDIHKARKLLLSLYKYFTRMSVRSTPYGLFAGTASGVTDSVPTRISFAQDKYRLHLEFNIWITRELIRQISLHPACKEHIRYYVNNTLYEMDGKLMFVEQTMVNGESQAKLSSVTSNSVISNILVRAAQGATIAEMAATIEVQATMQQKEKLITDLIQSQVLSSELLPSVSSKDFVSDFLHKIDQYKLVLEPVEELRQLHAIIRKTTTISDLQDLRTYLDRQPLKIINKASDFFKTDLFYHTTVNSINKDVINTISEESYELLAVTVPRSGPELETFKQNFHRRYEEREIPLVQALDPAYGIGYGNATSGVAEYMPLIEGMPVVNPPLMTNEGEDYMEELREKAIRSFYKKKENIINIDPADIAALRKKNESKFKSRTPTSTYIFGTLLANSAEALDSGNFHFQVIQTHAPFAAKLLTRFAKGNERLHSWISGIIANEMAVNPGAILAEIVYLPTNNYANIALRQPFREYEIPYASPSTLDQEHQININDLLISVRDNRVILRSKKLNREIIPCLTNAHHTFYGQPIYKFLGDCAAQQVTRGFNWEWGAYANEKFLPRIQYKHLILSRARWQLAMKELNYKDDKAVKQYLDIQHREIGLPRIIVLADGDNELLLDLDSVVCRHILAKELCKRNLLFYEYLQSPEQSFLRQEGGSFANEMIITAGTRLPMRPWQSLRTSARTPVRRIFPPGSEWLFIKIYSGNKVQERILTDFITDFARQQIDAGAIDKWFFIRYNDPGHHLRVRFHRSSPGNQQWYTLLEQFENGLEPFFTEEQIIEMTTDTYHREIERYGASLIEHTETLFYTDSVAISDFLSMLHGNKGEHWRWLFALVSVDRLLDDFNCDTRRKSELLEKLSNSFLQEFSYGDREREKLLIKMMNDRYRKFQQDISRILLNKNADNDLADAYGAFEKRSDTWKPVTHEMMNTSYFQANRDQLLSSYVHMTMNRIFMANQRSHELVAYNFLNRFYHSILAQKEQLNEYRV